MWYCCLRFEYDQTGNARPSAIGSIAKTDKGWDVASASSISGYTCDFGVSGAFSYKKSRHVWAIAAYTTATTQTKSTTPAAREQALAR